MRAMLSKSWYTLETRQGKIECMYANPAHIWKDRVLMLKEGSTFPKYERNYYGANPIVRQDDENLGFAVQHYGYAFPVNTLHV
jgi:hypothetical protein